MPGRLCAQSTAASAEGHLTIRLALVTMPASAAWKMPRFTPGL
jgi:hypothetical protein